MRYTIQNESLIVEVDSLGAELRVLRAQADGYDYLWSGDPAVWGRVSPLLFPFVGGVKDGAYTYQGKTYKMGKHGFVRQKEFTVTEEASTALTLTVTDTPETLACFPFPFRLDVRFSLAGKCLTAAHTVTNTGTASLYFSLGAHPGLACEVKDALRFDKAENLDAYRLDNDLLGRTEPFLRGEQVWRIQADSFLEDAQILENPASGGIVLERQAGRNVRFTFNTPYLGIWAKPGAPYVCLEPWFGVDDTPEHDGELTRKRGVQHLPPGEALTLLYTIETLS